MKRNSFHQLLDNLPPESREVAEQFLRFLDEQARHGRPVVSTASQAFVPRYPTVPLPPSALDSLVNLMPAVGGDALIDSEALYDLA